MTLFIIIFGILTCLAGIVIFVNPQLVFGFLQKHSDKIELHILAVTIRLILGAVLIAQSVESKYPLIIEIFGWISIIAAIVFAAIGRRKFTYLMSWALSQVKNRGRIGGIIATIFGAFLVHAFI